MFYFDENEIKTVVQPELVPLVNEIKQRYDLRLNFYNQLRQNTLDINSFGEINKLLPDFQKKYSEWNQKWNNVANAAKNGEHAPITSFFIEGNQIFSDFEEKLPRIGLLNLDEGSDAAEFKREILSKVAEEVNNLKGSIDENVDKAINHLLNIKSESLLEKDFSSSITETQTSSNKMSFWFFIAYLGSIFLSLAIFISTFYIEKITTLSDINQAMLRISVVAFLWLSTSFIYSHYRFYKTLDIKYNHLATLLGGGATHINSLIKDGGEDIKNETYQKLVNQFMDITDLTKMFGKTEHPSIKATEKIVEAVKNATSKQT